MVAAAMIMLSKIRYPYRSAYRHRPLMRLHRQAFNDAEFFDIRQDIPQARPGERVLASCYVDELVQAPVR